jgi:hypothetical protein
LEAEALLFSDRTRPSRSAEDRGPRSDYEKEEGGAGQRGKVLSKSAYGRHSWTAALVSFDAL